MNYQNWSARGRAPTDDEDELRAAVAAGPAGVRRDAAVGLVDAAETGLADATVEALAERIRVDDDSEVRQFAVEALGVAGQGAEAVRTALEDDDPWVRSEAVVAHSRIRPGDEATLRTALEDDSGWVRRNAVIALGKTGAASQSLLVDRIKNDPHPPVREYAAQFLGAHAEDVPEAVRILAAVLAREPNAFARAKAAESLGQLGTDRAQEALETQGLGDRSDDVKRTAKRALAEARGEDPENIDLPGPAAPGGGPDRPEDGPAAGDPAVGGGPGEWAGPGGGSPEGGPSAPAPEGRRPRGPDAGTHGGDRR